MSCQHCVASTTKALEAIDGINNVTVDLQKGEAHYEGDVDLDVKDINISEALEQDTLTFHDRLGC